MSSLEAIVPTPYYGFGMSIVANAEPKSEPNAQMF
jgi:hypothetical protein